MKILNALCCLLFFLLSNASSFASVPDNLKGSWTLQIENKDHKAITRMTIHFTEAKALSCMGGNWFKIVVDSNKTTDSHFFPVDEPLSYELVGNKLVIGRNEICDAYLQLVGEFTQEKINGEYLAVSFESQRLGYFSLAAAIKE